jgi:TrmH family RNA methyltransferase
MIRELAEIKAGDNHSIHQLFATGDWISRNENLLSSSSISPIQISPSDIKKLSNLVTPPEVMALVKIPDPLVNIKALLNTSVLAFESIRDPGNLGTIIRTADWFGIDQIICSPDSVDVYNPKVVQSTMGAITRVSVLYAEIYQLLDQPEMKEKKVYGTFLEGDDIYQTPLGEHPLILFGNESHGLSNKFDSQIHQKISIPSFSRNGKGSESLNVASSVAVVCSELRRGVSLNG